MFKPLVPNHNSENGLDGLNDWNYLNDYARPARIVFAAAMIDSMIFL